MAAMRTRQRPSRFWLSFEVFALPVFVLNAYEADGRGSLWSLFWAVLAIAAICSVVEWVEWLVRDGRSS